VLTVVWGRGVREWYGGTDSGVGKGRREWCGGADSGEGEGVAEWCHNADSGFSWRRKISSDNVKRTKL
jgi:hypothetical protein